LKRRPSLAQEERRQASRAGRHPAPGSSSPAQAIQEVSRPGLPRGQPSRTSRAPRGLRSVRGRLPRSRRETPGGEPQRLLPRRELSSRVAVRRRIGRRRRGIDLMIVLDWHSVSGGGWRSVELGSSGKDSGSWGRLFWSRSSQGREPRRRGRGPKDSRRRASGGEGRLNTLIETLL
jgi:hypothetical protein